MKKVCIFLLNMFLIGQLIYGQQHIHWGSKGDPKNGLTITWQSTGASDSIRWGYTTSYEKGKSPGIRRADYSGYLYDYTFPTVNQSSILHYSIFSNNQWITDKIFKTSVDPASTKFSFIAAGDSRTNLSDWEASANKMAADSADFMLFLGDHLASGTNTVDWDNWYFRGVKFLEKELVYNTGGNHEYGAIYLNQFVMPGNEDWYSFEFGDALFICLLTQNLTTNASAQHTFLLNELAATTKKWKVIFFHKPFFTTGGHMNDMNNYRSTWWKAFDDYGVDLVLGGHTHYYLRSKPINLNVSSTAPVAEYGSNPGQGRLQVTAGSIGAPLSSVGSAWYIEKNLSVYHYSKFFIDGNIMKFKTYNLSGDIIDSLTIKKQIIVGMKDVNTGLHSGYKLNQNYPNPFNGKTTITYHLSKSSNISLKILDITGKELETLVQEFQSAGNYQINWQPKELISGIYFYKLEIKNLPSGSEREFSETKKLIYLK